MDQLKKLIEERKKKENSETQERLGKIWKKELFNGRDDIRDLIKGIVGERVK